MLNKRGCGILLHPTSLPGPGGIGTLGADARRFIDLLHDMGMSYWPVILFRPSPEYAVLQEQIQIAKNARGIGTDIARMKILRCRMQSCGQRSSVSGEEADKQDNEKETN